VVCDARGRAVLFAGGEPSGLTRTMGTVLAQLREVAGPDAPILLGFDRGGSYPSAFTACREAGMDWVTYRRGALVATHGPVRRSWTVRDGRRVYLTLIDESIEITGYGTARQLTLIEDGLPVLQVLTSDTRASGAALLCWLRARWRIENLFKCASDHNGIDALADYVMTLAPNTALVPNPARRAARAVVTQAEQDLATAQRSLAQMLAGPGTPKQMNAALPGIHRTIAAATRELEQAKQSLAPIRAKLPANVLDPTPNEPAPGWNAAACRWSCGSLRSTPRLGSPSTSTATSPTPMSTARSCATYSTKAAPSTTPPPRSPSPWTDPTPHE